MDGMKIISLQAANVKRLKAIEIKPDGSPVVVIGGENGHGKTSVLDSIMYALAGKGVLPPKPVRDGEEEATITVDVGEYVVTRIITPDGKSTLKVLGKDGGKFLSPQTILDGLVGNLSFDPLAFSRMDAKAQVETLKKLVGLDFSPMDRKKAALTEDRLNIGREVRTLEGQLKGLSNHPDAPKEEVAIADISRRLKEARDTNDANRAARKKTADATASHNQWEARAAELRKELAEAESAAKEWSRMAAELAQAEAKLKDVDETAIMAEMAGVDVTNRKVRENIQRESVAKQLVAKDAAYRKLSEEISGVDGQKAAALAAAKFPVDGLAFDDLGVTVRGMPFQQASAAEQLKVSVAMGAAMNPKLRVMIVRDGSLLDAKSMQQLADFAAEYDLQVWLERVGEGDETAVIIEDGMVASKATSRRKVAAAV